ncbi:MAG: RagB/SusD family nutrient uptake outer membrane protein [Bacteroides sp.]|nr:RagB/SusD family nutrient uptake outer membrane protein [Bacteroides sp.]
MRKLLYSFIIFFASLMPLASCTDTIAFGNSFLEKAPGGDVTEDTIFSSAEYTRSFLAGCYSRQYYGLTFATGLAHSVDSWVGKFDALTDLYQLYYSSTSVYKYYYTGSLDATIDPLFTYDSDYVWEAIRYCLIMLEHIDAVPDMDDEEKECIKAECYCLMATRYFDAFQWYGGLPIVTEQFTGSEESYEYPRATAEETVEHIISLLDKAIAIDELPWVYDDDADTETGHWTKAGAMALKCRVLQFAASPLFNSDTPYYGGSTEAEQQYLVWYGGYNSTWWTRLKTACEEFLTALAANGGYELCTPEWINSAWTDPTPDQYRLAYRYGYLQQASPEILHQVRVTRTSNSKYNWFTWVGNGRILYCPTQDYVEKFPYSDGTPFDWDEAEAAGTLDSMYFTATISNHALSDLTLTRDPRLYENAFINGVPTSLSWSTATTSGVNFETWIGGYTASSYALTESNKFATGYYCMKFILNKSGASGDAKSLYLQWPTIRLPDVYLMYAEALIQTGDCTGALEYINLVRARVGLGNLEEMDTRYDYTTNSEALLEELLDERAREFGMENIRYFDLIRYKRSDIFEKQLSRLLMYRQTLNDDGEYEDNTSAWYGNNTSIDWPLHYRYEKANVSTPVRYWWTYGYDPKWYLAPFPTTEINKEYGLIQNPGW